MKNDLDSIEFSAIISGRAKSLKFDFARMRATGYRSSTFIIEFNCTQA